MKRYDKFLCNFLMGLNREIALIFFHLSKFLYQISFPVCYLFKSFQLLLLVNCPELSSYWTLILKFINIFHNNNCCLYQASCHTLLIRLLMNVFRNFYTSFSVSQACQIKFHGISCSLIPHLLVQNQQWKQHN